MWQPKSNIMELSGWIRKTKESRKDKTVYKSSWSTKINKPIKLLGGKVSLEKIFSGCEPFTRKLKLDKMKQKAEEDQFHFTSRKWSNISKCHKTLVANCHYWSLQFCVAAFQISSVTQLHCKIKHPLIHTFLSWN